MVAVIMVRAVCLKKLGSNAPLSDGIMPCDARDFRAFSTGVPLNEKSELLLAHLRGDIDFEANLAE
jgi:hypothetical protein